MERSLTELSVIIKFAVCLLDSMAIPYLISRNGPDRLSYSGFEDRDATQGTFIWNDLEIFFRFYQERLKSHFHRENACTLTQISQVTKQNKTISRNFPSDYHTRESVTSQRLSLSSITISQCIAGHRVGYDIK